MVVCVSAHLKTSKNIEVLLAELKECSKRRNLQRGQQIHAEAAKRGHDSNIFVASALINMYTKCGSMADAHEVFDNMVYPADVVSWTTLILGYADNGQGFVALNLFLRMRNAGPAPNAVTFVAALKACSLLAVKEVHGWLHRGKKLYNLLLQCGCDSNVYVVNALINLYAGCGSMVDASQVFSRMKCPTVVSWTALILGYAENGQGIDALDLFTRMRSAGPEPDYVTFVAALKSCTSLANNTECKDRGKCIHNLAINGGYDSNISVQNTLIDMYAKAGSMVDARQVFDIMKSPDVVSWNILVLGYAENGQGFTSLDLFRRMRSTGLAPNSVSLLAALKACASIALTNEATMESKELHDLSKECECDSDIYVQNTLIDIYAKCGSMVDAREMFDNIKRPTVVSWNVIISGYAENGQGVAALDMFTRMDNGGIVPDSVTVLAVLKVCAVLGALDLGRKLHSEITSRKLLNMAVVTCLVDFYAKCGDMVEARSVFDLHSETRDVITWNALLGGFSSYGDHKSLFEMFEVMRNAGFWPDSATFLSILMCCSHAGLLEKGKECFETMSTKYDIVPSIEHYTCMVDVCGRNNKLDDAMALCQRMSCSPDNVTWMTVLGACRKRKNVEIGRLVFQSLIDLSDKDGAAYVLIGQIYGSRGMFQEQEMVIKKIKSLNHMKFNIAKQKMNRSCMDGVNRW